MINKLICFMLGHKFREKNYTGDYAPVITDPLGRATAYYIWKDLDYCPRCGKKLK